MSKNKSARIKEGRQQKSWARQTDPEYGYPDDDMVITKGGLHLSNETQGTEAAANNSNIIPGREQERLEQLKLAISQLHDRQNSHDHVQSPKKTERRDVTAPLPITKRPLSSPDFWYAFRANVHGRTEAEEKAIVHNLHSKVNEVIKKVKLFRLKLEDSQQTGCTIDDVLRLAAERGHERHMERDRILGRLTIRHAGAAGIVPKKVAADLVAEGRRARNPHKPHKLEQLLEFVRACREIVPACSWDNGEDKALALWNDNKKKPMNMQSWKEKLMPLSVEAMAERLLKELDEVEEAHRLVHVRQARLKGSKYGKVGVETQKSTDHVKGSLAVQHKEYRMLDPDDIAMGKSEGIDPTFAIHYNALRQWLAAARALRKQTEEMREMLKDAQHDWYVCALCVYVYVPVPVFLCVWMYEFMRTCMRLHHADMQCVAGFIYNAAHECIYSCINSRVRLCNACM
jgi:hypothetical protein